MIDVQEVCSRIKLREKILQELYVLWFSAGPDALTGTKKELYPDSEHHKVFHYLPSSDLVNISSFGEPSAEKLTIFISAKGIDYVEERLLQESQNRKITSKRR